MAEFVGAFAASHGPLLIREWQAIPAEQKKRLAFAYEELGRRLAAEYKIRDAHTLTSCSTCHR